MNCNTRDTDRVTWCSLSHRSWDVGIGLPKEYKYEGKFRIKHTVAGTAHVVELKNRNTRVSEFAL
jgi:hypothetical protein